MSFEVKLHFLNQLKSFDNLSFIESFDRIRLKTKIYVRTSETVILNENK